MAIGVDRLPPELWRKILGHATEWEKETNVKDHEHPKFHLLPPFHKKSKSTRVKLSLTLVSRFFNSIATGFLYEVVSVSSPKAAIQLSTPSLAGRLRRHTKVLQIQAPTTDGSMFYSLDDWNKIFFLVASCKRLRELDIDYIVDSWPNTPEVPPSMAMELIDSIPRTVTCLNWAVDCLRSLRHIAVVVYLFLQRTHAIDTLYIELFHDDSRYGYTWNEWYPKHSTCLEHVTRLMIDAEASKKLLFSKLWRMPNLRYLATSETDDFQADIGNTRISSVTSLEFVDEYFSTEWDQQQQYRLSRLFPSLQELTYMCSVASSHICNIWEAGVQHSTVRVVNIVIYVEQGPPPDNIFEEEWNVLYAHLRGISLEALPSLNLLVIRNLHTYRNDLDGREAELRDATTHLTSNGVVLRMEMDDS